MSDFDVDAFLAQPVPEPEAPEPEKTTFEKVAGPVAAVGQMAIENWKPIAEIGGIGAGAYKLNNALNTWKEASNTNLSKGLSDSLTKAHSSALQYAKNGLEVPQDLKETITHLSERLKGLGPVEPDSLQQAKVATEMEKANAVRGAAQVEQATLAQKASLGSRVAQNMNALQQFAMSKVQGLQQMLKPVAPYLEAGGELLNRATPAMTLAMPYQAAGHEMEKIRANPTAPQYASNPYAMVQRGEAPTMGAAGAMNRRRALQQLPSLQGPIAPGQQ